VARILAIDDDETLLVTLTRLLVAEGHEVHTASEGYAGIRLAGELQPDLVLCDIVMPDPNGFEVLGALRRDPRTSAIPLIFLTGVPDPTQLRAGNALGAEDYLLKPFTRSELIQTVEARLTRLAVLRREAQRRLSELRPSPDALAHEGLCAPLGALSGLSAFLREEAGNLPPEMICEIASGIWEGTQRLRQVAERLSLCAELEQASQRGAIDHALDRAGTVVVDAAKGVARRVGREGDLRTEVEDLGLGIDPGHLRAVVAELAANAFAHSKAGSPILVRCARASGGHVELSVSDRGEGLSPEQVAALELGGDLARALEGKGLGLVIVKRVAALYGGQVRIQSVPLEGTQVTVRLPAGA
jgi:two-component system sensor histidine kinase/response regulator